MDHYNLFQQLYCLSMVPNLVAAHQGSEEALQDALKKSLNELLPQLPGNWSISWGPRVYKVKRKDPSKGGPDNVWLAAVDETQKICVVAIAGTALNSLADIYQDLWVHKVVDFNAWVDQWSPQGIPKPKTSTPDQDNGSALAYCAKGTCIGVWNVLNNVSTEAGEGTRIDQYLSSLDSSYTIVVAGHSLGGALSPIAALGLVKANLVGNHTVKVLPSAGVSPGNDVLAADYAAIFPKDPPSSEDYQVFNAGYYNAFDVVPQAWSINSDDDRNLPNIVDTILHCEGDLKNFVNFLLALAVGQSKKSQIRYTPLPGQRFAGPPPPAPVRSWDQVTGILGTQHGSAYWDEIGISEFINQFYKKFSKRVGAQGSATS
ncbi:hypothetical protein F5B21DRAFT_464717 [Xylaria acuta]|nr:hypothetical protein F5B21DRAFT_464717 [Xylaria acuta]